MLLAHSIAFDPADPRAGLSGLPQAPGVFALFGADPAAEPYLSKTPNLRRRLTRFLRGAPAAEAEPASGSPAPEPKTRRLRLAHMVSRIEYTPAGGEFESALCLYQASLQVFGDRARRRLRLRPPAFLRMSVQNAYPRVYVTTRLAKSAAHSLFGPFPSRAAAERYAEEMLNLFLLRRCTDDLHPDPAFPGCPYSEMKMCLAPCFRGCSDERYRQEADEVLDFLSTRGAGLLCRLEAERNAASDALQFEQAQQLHQRIQKVQAVAQLAGEAVRPLAQLTGILIQPAADPQFVALFGLRAGLLRGPAFYSTVGMRLPNERSGSSSLFPHPVALEAVPLPPEPGQSVEPEPKQTAGKDIAAKDILEARLDEALLTLENNPPSSSSQAIFSDHLALFARWFYRPAAQRIGEVLFAGSPGSNRTDAGSPGTDGELPRKPLLRAIARVAARAAGASAGAAAGASADASAATAAGGA